MRYLKLLLAALALGAWAAGSMPSALAQTAPSYQSSEPAKDAMMDHPPSEVMITFDQPLDESSWINVLDECGNEIDGGPATVNLNEMTVDIAKTPSGMYEVVYKAVGLAGATGSSASKFEFMVHHGKPCGGGHGGHPPGHGDKKKHKKPHDDHDPGDDHDEHMDDDGSGHSDHGDMPGMTGSSHSGHTMAPAGGHGGGHGRGHGNHHDKGGNPPVGVGDGNPPVAVGDTIPVSADAEAVLLGLGLALAVGVLGGWLLRMSGNLSGA